MQSVLAGTHSGLHERYQAVRAASEWLCEGLQPEDTVAQSMPEASPVKWHLAHTSWFFETFVLEKARPDYRPFNRQFRVLFNSYYNSVGEQYRRPDRGLITRPTLADVMAYREHVDGHMRALLRESDRLSGELAFVVETGLHHEQQHQELILTDLKHLFSFNPLYPAYPQCPQPAQSGAPSLQWHRVEGGLYTVGHDGRGFAFDNETPAHQVYLEAFEIASRPVTNGEFLRFMQDDGYRCADLWLSDAWALLGQQGWRAPLYWFESDGRWWTYTLGGLREVREDEPVTHVSYYEADAYARWAGARLPREHEWEVALRDQPLSGNFVESGCFHPVPAPAPESGETDLLQAFGDVWEWTQSPYAAYPGYSPPAGELAEYNGKFMCNQMVLRGGSCATPCSHIRPTYRNFFFPAARWQFSGLRLARDAP